MISFSDQYKKHIIIYIIIIFTLVEDLDDYNIGCIQQAQSCI